MAVVVIYFINSLMIVCVGWDENQICSQPPTQRTGVENQATASFKIEKSIPTLPTLPYLHSTGRRDRRDPSA